MDQDISTLASYGWAGGFVLLVALLFYIFLRRSRAEDEAHRERARQKQELEELETSWATALTRGDLARAHALKLRIDELRKALGLALLCLVLCGCRSAPAPAPEVRTVALSEHCRAVAPGDTVPELPPGESLYLLCTPTGLRMLLPAGSTIPVEKP